MLSMSTSHARLLLLANDRKIPCAHFLRLTVLAACLAALPPLAAADDAANLRHAHALLKSTPLVDGHNDLPIIIAENKAAPADVDGYDLNRAMPHETDIARMRRGHLSVQFWAAYVPGELKTGWARMGMEQVELTRRMIAKYPADLAPAYGSADIERAFKAGRIASLIGLEGGHMIENSLGLLRAYYLLGARYMTLTHNVTLDWADAALDAPTHHGLTPFGKEVVREMNRLGMLVDISHVSAEVMRDALDTAAAPLVFSHSSARALTDHPRNVPDEILARMPKNRGVVMVTYVPDFVSPAAAAWGLGERAARKAAGAGDGAMAAASLAYEAAHGKAPQATLAAGGRPHRTCGADRRQGPRGTGGRLRRGADAGRAGRRGDLPGPVRRADRARLERRRPAQAGRPEPDPHAARSGKRGGAAAKSAQAVDRHDRAAGRQEILTESHI